MFYDYIYNLGSGFILETMTIHKLLISIPFTNIHRLYVRTTQSKHFSAMLKTDRIRSEKDVK